MRGPRKRRRRRSSSSPGAWQELDVAYSNGCLIIAAVIGAMTGSGHAFLLALIAPVAGGYASGEVRPRRRDE